MTVRPGWISEVEYWQPAARCGFQEGKSNGVCVELSHQAAMKEEDRMETSSCRHQLGQYATTKSSNAQRERIVTRNDGRHV